MDYMRFIMYGRLAYEANPTDLPNIHSSPDIVHSYLALCFLILFYYVQIYIAEKYL